ncbi:MAG: CDC48 family AAA ATPase [Candidatus Syntropharchaeia archaeon]
MNEVYLKVMKAYPTDLGRGIARLDPDILLALDVSPGDIIEIVGGKKTAAKVWRADRQDWGQGFIRIDGFTRQNADVGIGDRVCVRKADVSVAKRIVLAPPDGEIDLDEDEEEIKQNILKRPMIRGDVVPVMSTMDHPFMGGMSGEFTPLIVVDTKPEGVVIVEEETEVILYEKPIQGYESIRETGITYEDIGGLKEEIQKVREMIELPLKHPEIFQQLGIEPPKGVLLHGPPGTGKTLIAKAVACESGARFFYIAGPEIMSKYYGESEGRLREIFEEAEENAPSIIFIDELDSIAPKREEVVGEVERRVVAQLLTMMDGLRERGQVIVIGATNRINAIDGALRRPGRFDREIELRVPRMEDRKEILQIHTRGMPLAEDVDLDDLAARTHGFVGADLEALSKEAAMRALRRFLPEINLDKEIPKEVVEKIRVTGDDFRTALKEIEPSAIREILVETPKVKWKDVGGLDDVKREIREAIEIPLKRPEKFKKLGIKPPKGILLIGPPGTGKTLIAKAVATESEVNFISVRGPQLLSKWVGESERAIREVFRIAKQVSPSIVFFDELDAIAPMRGIEEGTRVSERVVNQLLTEMDGLEELKDVIVVGATNRPDIIDPALIRPGRFDRVIIVRVPTKEGRKEIFKIHTQKMPLADDVEIDRLVELTEGYVGADIEAVCREAAMLALRENFDAEKIEFRHFEEAIKKIKPTITEGMMDYYERICERFRGGVVRGAEKAYIR